MMFLLNLMFQQLTGHELSLLIPFVVRELKEIGYAVKIVNMDQSGVNRRAYSLLGVTKEEPSFFVDDQKVWAMFDLPHLYKSVSHSQIYKFLYNK